MKTVSFQYQTELVFSSPASDHRFMLKILPQSDGRQNIKRLSWHINPHPTVWHTSDGFGNKALSGFINAPHDHFRFGIQGMAEVSGEPYTFFGEDFTHAQKFPRAGERVDEQMQHGVGPVMLHSPEKALGRSTLRNTPNLRFADTEGGLDLPPRVLLYPTELTQVSGGTGSGLADFYIELDRSAAGDTFERVQYFSHAVHTRLRYEREVTVSATTAQEAFDLGAGVCQDYAHILLALLRKSGIPCRYVAGLASDYGETHAWVEAWISDRYYGIDPTRDKLIDEGYIALSRGRDFEDCSVERGVFKGACRGTQTINLSMEITQ